MALESPEAALVAWQDTNIPLPHIQYRQVSDGVGGVLPGDAFLSTHFEFHEPSLAAANEASGQLQECLLAQVALKSHMHHRGQDWWCLDSKIGAAVVRNLGRTSKELYRGVVGHFPEMSVMQHRATEAGTAAWIFMSDETESPETVFWVWDNGKKVAGAQELIDRWINPDGDAPNEYAPAAQRLADAATKDFGGQIIAVSGDYSIDISNGRADVLEQKRRVAAIAGNFVIVRLPHINTEPKVYPALRLVPPLSPSLAEAV